MVDLMNDPEFLEVINRLNEAMNLANKELEAKGEKGIGGVTVETFEDGMVKIYLGNKGE